MGDRYREIASIIDRFTPTEGETATRIDGLHFARRDAPSQPIHTAQWPCFALVAQGAKTLALGSQIYTYGVGDYLVVSVDLPVMSRVAEASAEHPHLGLGMAIDPAKLNDVLRRTSLPRHSDRGESPLGVTVTKATSDLVDAAVRLLRLLDHPEDIRAMAPLIEQEILYRLLVGPTGSRLLQIATEESPGNRVAKAISWLRTNFMQPLRIKELSERAGMSPSSLHHHFKLVTAMTPVQFQKQLRLNEARRLMLVERMDVGSAGYSVGYQSPSQFSREYRRLYGVAPTFDVGGGRLPRLMGAV